MGGGGEGGNSWPPALLHAERGTQAAQGQSSDQGQRGWLWAVKAHGRGGGGGAGVPPDNERNPR